MHSHLFVDLDRLDARIDELAGFVAYGVTQMAISSQYDPDAASSVDGEMLDLYTFQAWQRHPDFFLRFCRGVQIGNPDAAAYVNFWLALGFEGVGELFVHGHQGDLSGDQHTESLVAIGKVAAEYGVPVAVHWDIGSVDQPYDDLRTGHQVVPSAEDNFVQMLTVLSAFPNTPIQEYVRSGKDDEVFPLKLIVCHCGLGPDPVNSLTPEGFLSYQIRLQILLDFYPNVYFDVAGMLVGDDLGGYQVDDAGRATFDTNVYAEFILTQMAAHPSRFLLGNDVHQGTLPPSGTWQDYVARYGTFLEADGTLTADDRSLIKFGNASAALYDEAP